MKNKIKILLLVLVLGIGLLVVASLDNQEVFLESQESKTAAGSPVYNKIKFFPSKNQDVWMMNQSHHGRKSFGEKSWDRLAIVIDKTQTPNRATFYQLEPGPLEWTGSFEEKPFKVSCFMCHNNGPRAIRPNYASPLNPTTFQDRIKISVWNLRMKFYGRVLPAVAHDKKDQALKTPFRFHSRYENETLQIKTCMKCHKESGLFARGALSRQQIPTIQFMLESGEMPFMGFRLSEEEKSQLEEFLAGF